LFLSSGVDGFFGFSSISRIDCEGAQHIGGSHHAKD
jgi:hypothetical protein